VSSEMRALLPSPSPLLPRFVRPARKEGAEVAVLRRQMWDDKRNGKSYFLLPCQKIRTSVRRYARVKCSARQMYSRCCGTKSEKASGNGEGRVSSGGERRLTVIVLCQRNDNMSSLN
jgi:hypothetical protein